MITCVFECLLIDIGDVSRIQEVVQRIFPSCGHQPLRIVFLLCKYAYVCVRERGGVGVYVHVCRCSCVCMCVCV